MNKKILLDKLIKYLAGKDDVEIPSELEDKITMYQKLALACTKKEIPSEILKEDDKFLRLELVNRKLTDGEKINVYSLKNNILISEIPSPNCTYIWFGTKGDLFSQNEIETDTLTTYDVFYYKMPSIDELYEKYKYLKSYYLSPEERRQYYLEW